jgi:azurin
LRDEVDGQLQGAVVPLVGEFLSGVHRGRFSPVDGQLYVSGMAGWVTYTPDDGCFQRVRYTGDPVQLPVGFHVYENGVAVTFSRPLDAAVAADPQSHFAQCWNYRYSAAYGSAEFSPSHFGLRGHDVLAIRSGHVLPDGRTLFLEIPDLQPVSQLYLRLHSSSGRGHDLFLTVHKLDQPFTDFRGYQPVVKRIAAHPILSDLALAREQIPNPWLQPIQAASVVKIETGSNLSFATRSFTVSAGAAVKFTLVNPDVVPHNWALVKPGALERVGELANRLVGDPEAAARHYVPATADVLAYTDVVPPGAEFTIYFRAPEEPGRYPFLCTFPGHWMVMNGEMLVE